MDKSKKIAAILVGGKGTRLQPLISHVPKPLAPIGDEPFLFLLIRDLVSVGYKEIILLTGYRHEIIVSTCEKVDLGATLYFSQELIPLGTAGALKQAEKFLAPYDEFLLINGDTYLDDFTTIATKSLEGAIGLIGVIKPEMNDRYGSIVFNDETKIISSFQEKIKNELAYVNAGIYKFSSEIFSHISSEVFYSLEVELLPHLISLGFCIKAAPLHGNFYDIGLPESYLNFVATRKAQCSV